MGIHAHVEQLAIEIIKDIVRAQFASKLQKLPLLERTRTTLEALKHLIRTEYELRIIEEKVYLRMAQHLVETSKMTNGWIKYLTQNSAS